MLFFFLHNIQIAIVRLFIFNWLSIFIEFFRMCHFFAVVKTRQLIMFNKKKRMLYISERGCCCFIYSQWKIYFKRFSYPTSLGKKLIEIVDLNKETWVKKFFISFSFNNLFRNLIQAVNQCRLLYIQLNQTIYWQF